MSVITLASSAFNLGIHNATGGVWQLSNPSDSLGTNYVINGTLKPQFNLDDSRWLGDLIISTRPGGSDAKATTMVSGLSDDIRRITNNASQINIDYTGSAANGNGFRGFDVNQVWRVQDDALHWTTTLTNTSPGPVEFLDVGFPMLMNSYWTDDQRGIYEQCVGRHSFIGGDGSYIYWQRPNGDGPYLLLTTDSGTRLEYKNKARYVDGPFAENDPKWEGLVEYYAHSAAIAPARVRSAGTYLPSTSMTLQPNGTKTFAFTFRFPADYQGLREGVYASESLDVISYPGMVVPVGTPALLAIRSMDKVSIRGEDGKNIRVIGKGTKNGYDVYSVSFPQLGANKVTVNYDGRSTVLQYYSIRPVEELINSRSSFVANTQQAKTDKGYNGAYLQYDMGAKKLITWDDYTGGGWKQWMAGGSDDLGLGPAEFLSEKNSVNPVQSEVASVDYFIDNFLTKYLQSASENGNRTFQVYRWYDGRDSAPNDLGVWRAYNYIHIANTYLNMYRIAKLYPSVKTTHAASDYLTYCYETLNAMFNKIPLPTPIGDAAHHLGLMGESTYPDILAAFAAENRTDYANNLRTWAKNKYDYFAAEAYPFASEASIDTTAFETSYTLAKMFNDAGLAEKTQKASVAARGLQPAWYWYGSDNRHMGESWWNLGYETQLGAWQQQEYLLNYPVDPTTDRSDMIRSTYGAWIAGWANINSGQISADPATVGAASWQYQSELGTTEYDYIPNINGWWAWSGEADLGFWGGVRSASVSLVQDPIVGPYAYNGELIEYPTNYKIKPLDGVRQRVVLLDLGNTDLRIEGAQYTAVTVQKDRSYFQFLLEPVGGGAAYLGLSAERLPSGTYDITIGRTKVGQIQTDGSKASIRLPAVVKGNTSLIIQKVA